MNPAQREEILKHTRAEIAKFRAGVLEAYEKESLNKLLGRMNPFLQGAQGDGTAKDLVRRLMDASIIRSETTKFGHFLESIAIHVAERLHGGQKSGSDGIDLEFTRDGERFFVSIKSGPNWGNRDQHAKMEANFRKVMQTAGQGAKKARMTCVEGCMYGNKGKTNQGAFLRYCGQDFWSFLSGDPTLYQDILGVIQNGQSAEFRAARENLMGKRMAEFAVRFCDAEDGSIRWSELLKFNSGSRGDQS